MLLRRTFMSIFCLSRATIISGWLLIAAWCNKDNPCSSCLLRRDGWWTFLLHRYINKPSKPFCIAALGAVIVWKINHYYRFRVVVFNATFNNISLLSWRSALLVEETGVPRENHWPVVSHWQTLSYNVVLSTPPHEWDLNSQCQWL